MFLAVYSIWSAFKTFQEEGGFKNPIRRHLEPSRNEHNLEIPLDNREYRYEESIGNNGEIMHEGIDRW
jgi:hypothetical protein